MWIWKQRCAELSGLCRKNIKNRRNRRKKERMKSNSGRIFWFSVCRRSIGLKGQKRADIVLRMRPSVWFCCGYWKFRIRNIIKRRSAYIILWLQMFWRNMWKQQKWNWKPWYMSAIWNGQLCCEITEVRWERRRNLQNCGPVWRVRFRQDSACTWENRRYWMRFQRAAISSKRWKSM